MSNPFNKSIMEAPIFWAVFLSSLWGIGLGGLVILMMF
jgi:hypothetical protein